MNLHTLCLRCPHVQPPPYAGPCACTIDGRDIVEHVAAHDCPKGLFPAKRQPTPAEIEAQLEAQGYDPKRDFNLGGCCSPPQQGE